MRALEHVSTAKEFTLEMLFDAAFKCEYVPINNKKCIDDEALEPAF